MSDYKFFHSFLSPESYDNVDDKNSSEFKVAKAYYQRALHFYNRGELLIAIFMLQQSTRFAYYNLINLSAKPIIRFPDLKVMKTYVSAILPDFKDVFFYNSEVEEQLFQKMDMALTDKSSIKEHSILEEDILQLLERVEELLDLSKDFSKTNP